MPAPLTLRAPALQWMQNLADAHAAVSSRASSAVGEAKAAEADCQLAKGASKVCMDDEEMSDSAKGHCDENCLNIYLTMEANCEAGDSTAEAGKMALKICKDTDKVPPSLMDQQKAGPKALDVSTCDMALLDISKSCDLGHFDPSADDGLTDLCKPACMKTLEKNEDSCQGETDSSMAGSIKMLVSACSGCGGALMALQTPATMAECSIDPEAMQAGPPDWKPCNEKCHPKACHLASSCDSEGAAKAGFPPEVGQGIQSMFAGDKMGACACNA